jgi:hypothetical protein
MLEGIAMKLRSLLMTSVALLAALPAWAQSQSSKISGAGDSGWQQEFDFRQCRMSPTGRNQYFILEPGFQLELREKSERLVITVLDDVRTIDGVVTRVVESKEWKNGDLYEIARNFFAICEESKDVFYYGEDVDFYEKGKIIGHEGSWIAGKDGAKPGLIMPGNPKVGMKYYQEIAPGKAMDRAEIIKTDDTCKTAVGTFTNCLRTKEGTPLEPKVVEYKAYAPGVGLIRDGDKLIVKYGFLGTKADKR